MSSFVGLAANQGEPNLFVVCKHFAFLKKGGGNPKTSLNVVLVYW